MSRENIFEGATNWVLPTPNTKFSPIFTSDDLSYLKEIIDSMPERKEQFDYDFFEMPLKFIQEHADSFHVQGNFLYALRYHALVIKISWEENLPSQITASKIEFVKEFLRSNSDYKILHDLNSRLIDSISNHERSEIILSTYNSIIRQLGFDDFNDQNFHDYISKGTQEKDFEQLFFHWKIKKTAALNFPETEFIRDHENNHSRGYKILREEFNEDLLNSILEKNEKSGIIILKLAHEIRKYDSLLALKYAAKARFVFTDCKFQQGLTWVEQFHERVIREKNQKCYNDLSKSVEKLNMNIAPDNSK